MVSKTHVFAVDGDVIIPSRKAVPRAAEVMTANFTRQNTPEYDAYLALLKKGDSITVNYPSGLEVECVIEMVLNDKQEKPIAFYCLTKHRHSLRVVAKQFDYTQPRIEIGKLQ